MKQKVWDRVRAKLKVEFERKNITRCEVCGSGMMLSFAHRLKRRYITDEAELAVCALLCHEHHHDLEYGGHERMYEEITKIIEARDNNFNA